MLTVFDLLKVKGDGIWAISPETTTLEALRFMAEKKVGALLVLEGGILVGIISERDFVYRIAEDRACVLDRTVSEYMTTTVITVTPKQTIQDCMKLMTDKHIRHLPVLSENQLVGLISIGDVVKGIISEQSSLIRNLEDYIVGGGYGQ
ncbi:MAG: CBS domain-containing protein [Anaerolineaceae bacterium]|nr:CBS domain-containing protein [Anaerolineaceae bacterium]